MINQKCHNCGSSNFRADRALAGKIICAKCSTPFIRGKYYRSKLNFGKNIFRSSLPRMFYILISFIIILLILKMYT